MFRGVASLTLDTKGRIALPSRYRDVMREKSNGQMVITIDTQDRCLLLYPTPDWEVIQAQVEALPSFNPAARRIQRLLIGHATDVEMDAQGRFLLPAPLREFAGLEKGVTLIGQGKKFEIWSESHWQEQRDAWLEMEEDTTLPDQLNTISL